MIISGCRTKENKYTISAGKTSRQRATGGKKGG
jgi:hypothetical protein